MEDSNFFQIFYEWWRTHRDAVDLDVPVERGPEVIVPVLVGASPRDDARVHEGRHREVHQHEQGQDP